MLKVIEDIKYQSIEWTPEVVYKVYCKDDLNTLPLPILENMKQYLESVISNKLNEVKENDQY
jgi:hypothetical protein